MMIHDLAEVASASERQIPEWIAECEAEKVNDLDRVSREILEGGYEFIALAGPSCSGKTTTAHRLIGYLEKAGKEVKVLSTDDYFHDLDKYPMVTDGAPDFDRFECLKSTLLSDIIRGILRGRKVSLSRFDFLTGKRTDDVETYTPKFDGIVILEGIHALNPALYAEDDEYYKLALNVTEPVIQSGREILNAREVRLIRRIIRDEQFRNFRADQTLNVWKNVVRGEDEYIFPYFYKADALLSTSLAYEPCVWCRRAEESLSRVREDDPSFDTARELCEILKGIPPLSPALVPPGSVLHEFLGETTVERT